MMSLFARIDAGGGGRAKLCRHAGVENTPNYMLVMR